MGRQSKEMNPALLHSRWPSSVAVALLAYMGVLPGNPPVGGGAFAQKPQLKAFFLGYRW